MTAEQFWQFNNFWKTIIYTASILTAFGVIGRGCWKIYKAAKSVQDWVVRMNSWTSNVDDRFQSQQDAAEVWHSEVKEIMDVQNTKITDIHKTVDAELKTNTGGNVKDQMAATSKTVTKMDARQASFTQLSFIAIFENDVDGLCVKANKTLCELCGAEQEQLQGEGWLNFVDKPEREAVKAQWNQFVKNGNELCGTYTMVKNGKGKEKFQVEFYAIATRDKKGNLIIINGRLAKL